ncbi:FAD-dependent oxidoreductase, partial [Staphylococcus warneri]
MEIDEKGFIGVNDYLETNIDNMYALGDVIRSDYRHVK